MTNPVVLYGTQSNGETLPVQVDATGRLVAEGLQGQPGEQGPPGDTGPEGPPGPGVPQPYGVEGTLLTIVNGVPAWQLIGDNPTYPPEPPTPTDYAELLDDRDLTPVSNAEYSIFNDSNLPVEPPDPWNTYIRTLPTWESPAGQLTGLGIKPNNVTQYLTIDMPFRLNISGSFAKVLELHVVFGFYQSPSYYQPVNFKIVADNANLTPIQTDTTVNTPTDDLLTTFSFLVGRDDIGEVNFTLTGTLTPDRFNPEFNYMALQRWQLLDSSSYLLKQLATVKQQVEELKELQATEMPNS